MTLPELSIKRYVLAFMLNAVLVVFGLVAYDRLGVDRLPYVEFPVLTITTTLAGANPDIMDASVTGQVENAISSIPGIKHVQSSSSPGVSVVSITFDLAKDVDVAFQEVQAKISQVQRRLPDEAEPPIVAKVETNASPIMWLALQGDRTQQQLNQYGYTVLKRQLETIPGVGEVRIGGRRARTLRVEVDVDRLTALSLTPQDLRDALTREHAQFPGGFLVREQTERMLKLDFEIHDAAALADLPIAWRGNALIRLGEVATIKDDLSDFRALARFNGAPSVGLGIIKIANTNTVAIVQEVLRRVQEDIEPSLPPGMTLSVATNDAVYIQDMVAVLKEHLVEGTLLAALVVWLFLGSLRSTLIIALAIPVSLLGAVAVMHFAGLTFNSLTLLALLLLIGVVVDDAIVVLENIQRHQELGLPPEQAAMLGSNQVFLAVMAATLSLVSIFAPVLFLDGIIGKFFQSFAIVVTFGVLVSWFVALTLTPMLCARHLRAASDGRLARRLHAFWSRVAAGYARVLGWALAHRWWVVALMLVTVSSSVWLFGQVGKAFAPEEDEGRFIVRLKTPLGSSMTYTDGKLAEVEAVLQRHPEVMTMFAAIGLGAAGQVNQGFVFARMQPRDQRSVSQQELMKQLRKELGSIAGVQAMAAPISVVAGQRGEPLQFALTGLNLKELGEAAQAFQQRLSALPELGRLDLDVQLDLPQLVFALDRWQAAQLGVSATQVASAINLLVGGDNVARFNDAQSDGQRYDIRIKAAAGSFASSEDLKRIHVRGRDGQMIRLDTLVRVEETIGPAVVSRLDSRYSATFYGSPTVPMAQAIALIRDEAAQALPPGVSLQLMGEAEEFGKTGKAMGFALVLALLMLYMVLASQFNSFAQPLLVMLAQPLAVIGGIAGLWLMSMTLNVYSMIGLILLMGLVAKNSILLIDLTNQLRAQGVPVHEALMQACPIRLRPVLMTSLTIILAMLPAALGYGAGAATNGPLSVAVIGGMLSSTLLTLLVVPVVYSLTVRR